MGSGLLPTHIEHSVPDVASLFKKVLNALPGGLLGSLRLFDAFRNVFFQLTPSPELSDCDFRILQAKLIALAISSGASSKRVSLIQAVLGLVAYFGKNLWLNLKSNKFLPHYSLAFCEDLKPLMQYMQY